MEKFYILILLTLCWNVTLFAQSQEELLAQKAAKEAELAALQPQLNDLAGRVDVLKAEIETLAGQTTPYPRWDVGALGNAGLNFANFSNWLSKSDPNTTAFSIATATSAFANLDQQSYFWRNNGNLTLGWIKFDDRDDPEDTKEFRVAADAFNASSLFGYKLSEKIAISALGEYRTAVLEGKFNNPGYLDLGAGMTWTPVTDLVVVVHPLNYNFVFSRGDFEYQSSLGAKLLADYKKEFSGGFAWKSNLSAFLSYEDGDLSNWTWVNGVTTSLKGFGFGFDVGLRGNKQEALAAGRVDNPLQAYWLVGISYGL